MLYERNTAPIRDKEGVEVKSRGDALRDYVIRRLLLMIPTFLGITLVTFTLLQFVPGGQIDQIRMQLAGAGQDLWEVLSND